MTLTCAADLSSCPHLFVMSWSADSRDLAVCTSKFCGGSFKKREDVDVKMIDTGSTVTIQKMTRDSAWLNTQWACEFCGGSQLTFDDFVIYGESNVLIIKVDSRKLENPMFERCVSCVTRGKDSCQNLHSKDKYYVDVLVIIGRFL